MFPCVSMEYTEDQNHRGKAPSIYRRYIGIATEIEGQIIFRQYRTYFNTIDWNQP